MILLDYLYYQLTNFYNYFNKEGGGRGYGIIMVCALLWWNLIFTIFMLDFYFNTKLGPANKYMLLLYGLPILLLVSLRYSKYTSYEGIREKVSKMSNLKTTLLDIFVIVYVIISTFVMIGFAGYVGVSRHG